MDSNSNSNKSHEHYPTARVITAYSCFGGAIGGGVIGLILAVLLVLGMVLKHNFSQEIVFTLVLSLLLIPVYAFFGFMIGLIPATFTGWIAARLKLYRNYEGLLQSTVIGAISTVICALLLLIFNDITFSFAACIFAIVVGGISGYLTGLSGLPND